MGVFFKLSHSITSLGRDFQIVRNGTLLLGDLPTPITFIGRLKEDSLQTLCFFGQTNISMKDIRKFHEPGSIDMIIFPL